MGYYIYVGGYLQQLEVSVLSLIYKEQTNSSGYSEFQLSFKFQMDKNST